MTCANDRPGVTFQRLSQHARWEIGFHRYILYHISEHPEYLETYFDKKTNKTLTWNGKMWIDAMGNPAD